MKGFMYCRLGRTFFHADDGDFVLHACKTITNLHTDERAANHNNLLAIVSNGFEDVLRIGQSTQQEHIAQVALKSLEWQPSRCTACSQDELGVVVRLSGFRGDLFA